MATSKTPVDPTFLTDKDDAWAEATADVSPLGHGAKRASGRKPNPRRLPLNRAQREALKEVATRELPPAPQLAKVAWEIMSDEPDRLAGRVANFEFKQLKMLAEGGYKYTAQLDLHGMYEGDAYIHLMNWLQEASHMEHRCVLVICGKGRGYGPGGRMGLIKAQIAGWLANHPAVLAFHTALPQHGGAGAVYVYLRRP